MHSPFIKRLCLASLMLFTFSQEIAHAFHTAPAPVAVRGRRARGGSRTRREQYAALAPADDAGDPGSALGGVAVRVWTLTREAARTVAARLRTVASHALSTLDAPLVSHFPQLR